MIKHLISSLAVALLISGCSTVPAAPTAPPPSSNSAASTNHASKSSATPTNAVASSTKATSTATLHGTNTNKTSAATVPSNLVPVVISRETDGDTIHVTLPNGSDETIRMLLIDTPEDVKPNTPVEPFSLEAARYCASVLPVGKHAYIEEGKPGYTRDKYGRLLAYVYITPTDMYNEDVVKRGLARVAYIYPPNTDHLSELEADESYAKSRKLGIWSIPGYVTAYGYNLSATATSVSSKSSNTASSGSKTPGIQVVSTNLSVYPGQHASITVHVGSGVTGSIQVLYKSGPSHASGLGPKTADANGDITWTWDVGKNTTPGNWDVTISAGSKSITETLNVK